MTALTQTDIKKFLDNMTDPASGQPLLAMLRVLNVSVSDTGEVGVILDIGARNGREMEGLRTHIEQQLASVEGIAKATVVMSGRPSHQAGAAPVGPAVKSAKAAPPPPTPTEIPGVKHVIAVASGKGGVGKSTTSVNLAVALKQLGLKVGILDADIFGPSLPTLMNITEKPTAKDKILQPVMVDGVKAMSIGLLIDPDHPVVWRGPRVMGATRQMLQDVNWGPLDILVVDMPPGTGDVQLTMVQTAPLSGAVIVSTPQDLALIDARKGLAMFQKVDVPIMGVIENMSTFICPNCGHASDIFGHGGARESATELDVDFLGEIPLTMALRESADAGTPYVTTEPDTELTARYGQIAGAIAAKLRLVDDI